MTHWFEKVVDNVWLRGTLALLLALGMGYVFYRSLWRVHTSDVDASLFMVTPEKKDKFGPYVARVDTGIFVRNFPTFDVYHNRYLADMVVWFMFDPKEISLESLSQFSFVKGQIKKRFAPDVRFNDGKIMATFQVFVSFTPDLRFDAYPYDGHRLPIMLTNTQLTPGEAYFATNLDRFIIDERFNTNWELLPEQSTTQTGYSKIYFDARVKARKAAHPVAQFNLAFVPRGIKNKLIIFLPLLFAMLMSLFSFLVPYRHKGDNALMWSLAITSISTLLGYRFVLQKVMPAVGYMTTTDAVYTLALIIAFMPFLFQLILTLFTRKEIPSEAQGHEIAETLNVINISAFLLLALAALVLLYWILL